MRDLFCGFDPGLSPGSPTLVTIDANGKLVESFKLATVKLPKGSSSHKVGERLKMLTDDLFRQLLRLSPLQWFMEGYSHASAHQAHQLGELGGVVRYRALHFEAKDQLPFPIVAPPSSLKKFVLGRGGGKGTDKVAVAVAANRLWGLAMSDEHAYDALVLSQMARAFEGRYPTMLSYQQAAIGALRGA